MQLKRNKKKTLYQKGPKENCFHRAYMQAGKFRLGLHKITIKNAIIISKNFSNLTLVLVKINNSINITKYNCFFYGVDLTYRHNGYIRLCRAIEYFWFCGCCVLKPRREISMIKGTLYTREIGVVKGSL